MYKDEDIFGSLFDSSGRDDKEVEKLKNEVLEECWKNLNKKPELILDNFIIYVTKEHTYIIPPEGMSRIKFLDYLIQHFEAKEEFERCSHLLKIRKKISANINKQFKFKT